jgi:hypothetical protein
MPAVSWSSVYLYSIPAVRGRPPLRYTAFSVHFRSAPALLGCVFLASCVSQPDIYAPPAQRKPLDEEILVRKVPVIDFSQAGADSSIVQDIARGGQPGPWRWTGKRPTVRLTLLSANNLKFHAEFAVPEATFKDTGPVTLSFFVNDRLLDRQRYDTPGQKTFEKPVPAGWLQTPGSNTLAIETDEVWISKDDGAKLGFILSEIGLVQ